MVTRETADEKKKELHVKKNQKFHSKPTSGDTTPSGKKKRFGQILAALAYEGGCLTPQSQCSL
jgi:hypothetical protein